MYSFYECYVLYSHETTQVYNTLLNYVFHLIFVGFADYVVLNNLMLQLELFHNKRMKVETGSTFDKFRSKSVAVLIVIPVSSATRSTARKITHFPYFM